MRSTEEILAEQDIVFQANPAIAAADSTSAVSITGQLRKIWVLLVQMIEANWDRMRTDIDTRIEETKVGTLAWYVDQTKLFQLGDTVGVMAGKVAYEVYDEQKRIVVQATASEDLTTGRLNIRAAKKNVSALTKLTTEELSALKDYISRVKYAGVVVDVVSIDPDQVKILATCKYDRQVLSSTGALLSDATKFPVKDAISAYLYALPYTSVLNNTGLTDAVQRVKGVLDFSINESAVRRPVAITWTEYVRETVSLAGYAELHNDSSITYI